MGRARKEPEQQPDEVEAPAGDAVEAPAGDPPVDEPTAGDEPAAEAEPEQPEEAAPAPPAEKPKRATKPKAEAKAEPAKKLAPKKKPAAKAKAAKKPAERKPIVRGPQAERARGKQKERRGVVVSAAMDKTIVVRVDTSRPHPRYKKVVRRSTKFHAHDERNEANAGDVVRIVETRPLSKTKSWRLAEVLEAAR